MQTPTTFIAFTVKLAHALEQQPGLIGSDHSVSFTKLIMEAGIALPQLKEEINFADAAKKAAWLKELKGIDLQAKNHHALLDLALNIVNILKTKISSPPGKNSAAAIQSALFYILILIGDYEKSVAFCNTKNRYDLHNPSEDFWFQRVDIAGTHEFNTPNGNYLVNSIPPASSNAYSNSEVYNSPYTTQLPKNVIVNPYPVDTITDTIELENFIYDLFINIPFAPAHNIIFSAKIKVENINGGSRGWGFWNTNAIPVVGMKTAWFMQQQGNVSEENNGFFAHTFNGLQFSVVRLPDLDENWHEYQIVMNSNCIEYFIDGISVARVTNPSNIPNAPMAFHNWVDNACFENQGANIEKVLQTTTAARKNYTNNMRICTKE